MLFRSLVMPLSLSRLFENAREYTVFLNEYVLGESQRRNITTTSRKRWRLAKRLTTAELAALQTFFFARNGSQGVFYFYDGTETTPFWSWDATGVATVGRYTVRFDTPTWRQSVSFQRHETEIALAEVA